MAIIRIFKVQIHPELRDQFESDFLGKSLPYVEQQKGLLSQTVGFPDDTNPNEYLLATEWESVAVLQQFAGNDWQYAVIPKGMEKYVARCSVEHYRKFDVS